MAKVVAVVLILVGVRFLMGWLLQWIAPCSENGTDIPKDGIKRISRPCGLEDKKR